MTQRAALDLVDIVLGVWAQNEETYFSFGLTIVLYGVWCMLLCFVYYIYLFQRY